MVWHPEAKRYPGLLIFRMDAELVFPNAAHFAESVKNAIRADKSRIRQVLISAETMNDVDVTGAEQLIRLEQELDSYSITLSLAHIKDPVRETLRRAGAEAAIGSGNFYENISDGVEAFLANGGETDRVDPLKEIKN